jgi:hypothetical protein
MAVGAGLVAALMIAAAGAIALVALSLAVNDALLAFYPPAQAAGLTAVVFAAICGFLAIVTPRLISAWRRSSSPRASALNLTTMIEIALAIGAGLAEASRRRGETRRDR